jgi:hypothetical protein
MIRALSAARRALSIAAVALDLTHAALLDARDYVDARRDRRDCAPVFGESGVA